MRRRKILIIDRDANHAKEIGRVFHKSENTRVFIASSSEEALRKAKEESPDLVLTETRLRVGLDGIILAQKIQSLLGVPIIYLTQHSDIKTVKESKKTEPFGYITKPIDGKTLKIAVEMALQRYSVQRKVEEEWRQSEELYRKIVENINEGILMQDKDGLITYVNDKFLEMIGYKEADVLGLRNRLNTPILCTIHF